MRYFRILVLLILGLAIGAELFSGVAVAPVIFGAAKWLGEGAIVKEQSGILMTQIFLRLGVLIAISSILCVICAAINAIKERKWAGFILAILSSALACYFVGVATPFIIEAQAAGITDSAEFAAVHLKSEVALKLLVAVQIVLFWLFSRNTASG